MRRLLVPIDPSDFSDAATRRACEVVAAFDGSVTGLTVLDTEGVGEDTALPFHAEYLDYPQPRSLTLLKDAAGQLNRELVQFDEICRSAGASCEEARLSGNPADAILDLARFHDLLAIGKETHFHFETEEAPGDTISRVLDGAPIPILAVPAKAPEPLRRALVAFDGSPAATRALHAFARLWPLHEPEVRILTCERDKRTGGHLLDEARKYLEAHGVSSITTELNPKTVIEAAAEPHLERTDLVVAGIRSRHPIRHLFIGSFARYLIEKSDQTLLLSQ